MSGTTKKARVSRTGNYCYGSLQIHELSTPWMLHAALVFPFQSASNTIRKFRKGQQWPPLVCNGFCMRNKTVGSLPPNKLMIQDTRNPRNYLEREPFQSIKQIDCIRFKNSPEMKVAEGWKTTGRQMRDDIHLSCFSSSLDITVLLETGTGQDWLFL